MTPNARPKCLFSALHTQLERSIHTIDVFIASNAQHSFDRILHFGKIWIHALESRTELFEYIVTHDRGLDEPRGNNIDPAPSRSPQITHQTSDSELASLVDGCTWEIEISRHTWFQDQTLLAWRRIWFGKVMKSQFYSVENAYHVDLGNAQVWFSWVLRVVCSEVSWLEKSESSNYDRRPGWKMLYQWSLSDHSLLFRHWRWQCRFFHSMSGVSPLWRPRVALTILGRRISRIGHCWIESRLLTKPVISKSD